MPLILLLYGPKPDSFILTFCPLLGTLKNRLIYKASSLIESQWWKITFGKPLLKEQKMVDDRKKDSSTDLVITRARREQEERDKTYRERALKIFPWVCARCGREFSGRRLRELTVHHKDHDHDNNPLDGSNWELLCIYCHDNEHSRLLEAEWTRDAAPEKGKKKPSTYKAFADLGALLKKKG